MEKTTHEIIKAYIKENEGTGTVNLSQPNFWFEASRLHCWFAQ
ncbi:MAG: hypothetical protein APG08_00303 [Candidatus Methanofastidiosum methylothiophilum]|jgi:hypothetical protein|uniref:Uncharacterized protein n=1 Tax=Candidatus Methanofastidiosum methylothiophilum TaxID=1705564 RepID=A0A150JM77_9EURY|nr:MAG: hypothetical protein AN188_00382 [Candidatus Methanofastidiosum methylthiophilus]OQC52632.1 MAG: hypothetical protein BWX56_00214 [Euryarchaeota archaeon ADurb.Bin023]HNV93995.1 hypothetical protein [Methanofastidiosum sp.]KYC57422.1 MAG: hypothetical protein APG08_00303 [Candidatus Methanofastidiosum methylthiophilus]KYC58208.1 MAG: hypothetical protein APG09_00487 [Candidatus Methanofastidiosum methylthiophilus]